MCKATESVTYAARETLSGVGELFLGIDSHKLGDSTILCSGLVTTLIGDEPF